MNSKLILKRTFHLFNLDFLETLNEELCNGTHKMKSSLTSCSNRVLDFELPTLKEWHFMSLHRTAAAQLSISPLHFLENITQRHTPTFLQPDEGFLLF